MRQGAILVSEYAIRFSELSRHSPTFVSTVKDRVCRFIEGLNYDIRFSMARELETNTPFQQVVEIARRLEGMRGQDRKDREAKRPRGTRGFSGGHASATTRHCMGYASGLVHSVVPATSSALATSRSQVAYYALPLSNTPTARGAFSAMPGLPWLEWRGTLDYIPNRVVSFVKAHRMVEKGCEAYLALVRDSGVDTPTVESVPIVRDFPDVFSSDLLGMPPDKDIDFGIDLFTGTQPISIPPYRMALVELKDLKEHLQELLDKGFI
ncbi:uncharacterized protein [Nicotiana tomentosiformis]|uniref:uncharacterized protein n=1 Tax=Nicotiana tomentosiformis TaxID=4098 RepID=UPI00388C9C6C